MSRTTKNFLLITLMMLSLISMLLTIKVSIETIKKFNNEIIEIYNNYFDGEMYDTDSYEKLSNNNYNYDNFDSWLDDFFENEYYDDYYDYYGDTYEDEYYYPSLEEYIKKLIDSNSEFIIKDAFKILISFVLFFIESSAIILSLLYLILSDYNKYSSKYVFKKSKNVLMFIIPSLTTIPIITISLIIVSVLIGSNNLNGISNAPLKIEDGYINYNNKI